MVRLLIKRLRLNSLAGDLAILCIICFILGMVGGEPFHHPDFNVGRGLRVIRDGGHPHFFLYPSLTIYLNAIVYGFVYILMKLCGLVHTPVEFADLFYSRKLLTSPFEISFWLPGHLLTMLFSLLGVICTYLITYKLTGKRIYSFLSALFVSTSLLWITDSHFATVDILFASLAIATVLSVLMLTKKGVLGLKSLISLGLMLGLTTSAKYPGILVFSSILAPMIILYKKNYRLLLWHLLIIIIISAGFFVMTNPFMIIDYQNLLGDLSLQMNDVKYGHFGWTSNTAWLFHITNSLYFGYGLIALLLSALGLLWIIRTKTISISDKLAVMAFPVLYFSSVGGSKLTFHRYMIPIIPFLGIYSSLGVYSIYKIIKIYTANKARFLKIGLVFLVTAFILINIVTNVVNIIKHDVLLAGKDTREELYDVFRDADLNIADRNILAGAYVGGLFEYAGIYPGNYRRIKTAENLDRINSSTDIIIFDSFSHDRIIYDMHHADGEVKQIYNNYEGLYIIQISPYLTAKDEVPFSPKSLYSPYPPDLAFRYKQGPFIEIYCRDYNLAEKIVSLCNKYQVAHSFLKGKDGYYFRKINEKFTRYGKFNG